VKSSEGNHATQHTTVKDLFSPIQRSPLKSELYIEMPNYIDKLYLNELEVINYGNVAIIGMTKKVKFEDRYYLERIFNSSIGHILWYQNEELDSLNTGYAVEILKRCTLKSNGGYLKYNDPKKQAYSFTNSAIINLLALYCTRFYMEVECVGCDYLMIPATHFPYNDPSIKKGPWKISVPGLGITNDLKLTRPIKISTSLVTEKYGKFCLWSDNHDENVHELYTTVSQNYCHRGYDVWYHPEQMKHSHIHFASRVGRWTITGLRNYDRMLGHYNEFTVLEVDILDHLYAIAKNITIGKGVWKCHKTLDFPLPVRAVRDSVSTMVWNCYTHILSAISMHELPEIKVFNGDKYEFINKYIIRVSRQQSKWIESDNNFGVFIK
jgi:hypothetical protein